MEANLAPSFLNYVYLQQGWEVKFLRSGLVTNRRVIHFIEMFLIIAKSVLAILEHFGDLLVHQLLMLKYHRALLKNMLVALG